ncbi:hypothetical protein F5Y16DRAFT_405958 [Xylariaceae sp. FL0255]|nr:hypothetical protein F5Y16DRAFT_405958 [Xylariaceae sp. FL0255]
MDPDRFGRLVINGVLGPDDYYRGQWPSYLLDTDKIMSKLCEYCFGAGPHRSDYLTIDDFYLHALSAMAFAYASAHDFFHLLAAFVDEDIVEVAPRKQFSLNGAASRADCRESAVSCLSEPYLGLLGATTAIEFGDSAAHRYTSSPLTKDELGAYMT